LRKTRNLTQDKVSSVLGYVRNTLSNWETGITEPSIEIIKTFADFYNVDIDDIVNKDLSDAHLISKTEEGKNNNNAHLNAHGNAHLNDQKQQKRGIINEPKSTYNNELNELVKMKQIIEAKDQVIKSQQGEINALRAALQHAEARLQEPQQSKRKAG